ncbi:MAG: response regulator [Chloroflexaceae bacterium]|nr:response regulator [Chloroflexaceae bacterium]
MNEASKILIADDEDFGRALIAELLIAEGYQLFYAADGAEAVAQAIAHLPDLVLLDVMMPGMDGFEVCRQLRSDPRTAAVPIVIITAAYDRPSRLRSIEVGADVFMGKPIDRLELRTRVRMITRTNRYRLLMEERQRSEQQARKLLFELEHAYDSTIEGWAHALDLRDKETEGHSRRVTTLTMQLSRMFGLNENEIAHIRRGALLHDIGKLAISDSILLKAGPLTPEERTVMQMHPVYAYQWLQPIDFLRPALDIPHYHHEKWDGTGYPYKLCGDDIPLPARIFAVVDVWDAMTNDRPYRKALPAHIVQDHIRSQSGKHFDPLVVEMFLHTITGANGISSVHQRELNRFCR